MRRRFIVVSAVAVLTVMGAPSLARAQNGLELTPLQVTMACAMPPVLAHDHPLSGPRVVGVQDTAFRALAGVGDLLVIDSGLRDGLALDQRFFVRRPITMGGKVAGNTHVIATLGWLRISAINDNMAIGTVEHSCGAIYKDDHLEAFQEPFIPRGAEIADISGELDFTYEGLGRIVLGHEDKEMGVVGDVMLMDRGADQSVEVGARYAVYRDPVSDRDSISSIRPPGLPLAAIGEVIVMSTGPAMSVVRITAARDGVRRGDYLVPRR